MNILRICPPHLPHMSDVAALSLEIKKKSFFKSVIHTYLDYLVISEENKLQLLHCSLAVYLLLFSASCLVSDIPVATHRNRFFLEPAMPTRNRLFSKPPTFEGTQQTFSQMKKFSISQVSVVTFSRGVGRWVTVCFLPRYRK